MVILILGNHNNHRKSNFLLGKVNIYSIQTVISKGIQNAAEHNQSQSLNLIAGMRSKSVTVVTVVQRGAFVSAA